MGHHRRAPVSDGLPGREKPQPGRLPGRARGERSRSRPTVDRRCVAVGDRVRPRTDGSRAHARAAAGTAEAAGTCAVERLRLAGSAWRVFPGGPVDVPRGRAIHRHGERNTCLARVQRDCRRHAVRRGSRLWARGRLAPVGGWRRHGGPGQRARRADDGAGRLGMRSTWATLLVLLACATHASGQAAGDGTKWSFSAAVYTYFLPDESNYAQPTFAADRDWLHFEARYNYEDRKTGSVWAGYNFEGGGTVAWEFTPMVGGVFGRTKGVAPGYTGSLSWWKLDFYSEGEYVFDAVQSSDSFFYNWSELAIAPVEWFRLGLVTQRDRKSTRLNSSHSQISYAVFCL